MKNSFQVSYISISLVCFLIKFFLYQTVFRKEGNKLFIEQKCFIFINITKRLIINKQQQGFISIEDIKGKSFDLLLFFTSPCVF